MMTTNPLKYNVTLHFIVQHLHPVNPRQGLVRGVQLSF